MSIIGGVVCLDAGRTQVESETLAERFAGAGHVLGDLWVDDRCALLTSVDTARTSTPSVAVGKRFAAVADAHLHDVDLLAAHLGISAHAGPAEMVLLAFERWGGASCERLSGNFAFAVFDRMEGRLFGARDRFGVRPFYFHDEVGCLRFASDPAVLASDRIDRRFVAGFLAGLVEEDARTVDGQVRRLPPAHLFRSDASKPLAASCYWTLRPETPPRPSDVVDAFRERFSRAVSRCLNGSPAPGVLLSGGIDSTSISVTAARLARDKDPLRSFSLVFPSEPDVDEERYVDLVVQRAGLLPGKISGSDISPFHGWEAQKRAGFVSFADGPGSLRMVAVFENAAAKGCDVLLDGHGGDEVVWTGYQRAVDLARNRQVLRALAQVPGLSKVSGESPSALAVTIAGLAAPRNRLGDFVRRLASGYRRRMIGEATSADALDLLSPNFLKSTDLAERLAVAEGPAPSTDAEAHALAITSPRTAFAFEALRRRSAPAGIELRFPFFDADLTAFCLGLPSEEKLRAGWPRSVLRRAMDRDLPRAVCWRRDKTNFGPSLARGLVRWHRPLLEDLTKDVDGVMGEHYRMDALRDRVGRLLDDPSEVNTLDTVSIWRAAYLCLALSTSDARRLRSS